MTSSKLGKKTVQDIKISQKAQSNAKEETVPYRTMRQKLAQRHAEGYPATLDKPPTPSQLSFRLLHQATGAKSADKMDKIVEQYKLLMNPRPDKHLLLLKYPNREPGQLYSDKYGNKPVELRIKPKSGLVEVDIPMIVTENFDQDKGLEFGAALRKKNLTGKGGDAFYGLSGGLHTGSSAKKDEDTGMPDAPSREKLLDKFEDANNKGHVMNKITLGGRIIPFKDGDPIYMIATFQDGMCTWTPLDAMVELRPQFEHLVAIHDQQKPGARFNQADDEKKESKAEDVNMTVKDTEDDDGMDLYGGMPETLRILREMADEPWQRLEWIDSEDPHSHEEFNKTLVYQDSQSAPQLISELTKEQYLDAISCPRIDPINKGRNIMRSLTADPDDFGETTDDDGPADTESDSNRPKAFVDDKARGQEPKSPVEYGNKDKDGIAFRPNDMQTVWKDGKEILWIPDGIERPGNLDQEDLVDKVCRMIDSRPKIEHPNYVKFLQNSTMDDPKFSFLQGEDNAYTWFLWRLEESQAGRSLRRKKPSASQTQAEGRHQGKGRTTGQKIGEGVEKPLAKEGLKTSGKIGKGMETEKDIVEEGEKASHKAGKGKRFSSGRGSRGGRGRGRGKA